MQAVSRFRRAFPPPNFLSTPGAGIDISSGSVRSIVFSNMNVGHPSISSRKVALPKNVVVDGEIEKPDTVVEFLRSFRLREGIQFAHASLPEKKAFLYQTVIPRTGQGMRSAVESTLEEHVPIPPSEASFDFEIVRSVEGGDVVSVTVYATRIIEQYYDVFERAGITLLSLEVESHAIARALVPEKEDKVSLVVDFGKETMRLVVLDSGVASFTTTVEVGGDTLTKAVMKHYEVSEQEAETIKNEKGFLGGGEHKDLYETLMTTVSVVRDEIAGHILFWNSPTEAQVIDHKPITEIIMIGGNANLKGLPEFLARALDIPVRIGNVWGGALSFDEYIPPLSFHESLEYGTAIGLALRSNA
ncbi:hypothetical protein COU15_01670 [Candidatus Kaiserbacteria bacterium CG10_big_fil_rev_8_21_14_0_10_45_20]|uniref:SHS2 domain-containing protein n=1 Tax=Candidatus Kaiserbacteria bacterium CG10_big_fil_rev_8_21_14_0_10_45_20 TaxID=1974607 RepID=A0A2H0UFT3_9BACT|nr:MAG: hypothetical protein COU15_01670 [Candidatus Kaiserbacteria bacterium CG10_big_fil_rev_8_21_14_0_10_45_20]